MKKSVFHIVLVGLVSSTFSHFVNAAEVTDPLAGKKLFCIVKKPDDGTYGSTLRGETKIAPLPSSGRRDPIVLTLQNDDLLVEASIDERRVYPTGFFSIYVEKKQTKTVLLNMTGLAEAIVDVGYEELQDRLLAATVDNGNLYVGCRIQSGSGLSND